MYLPSYFFLVINIYLSSYFLKQNKLRLPKKKKKNTFVFNILHSESFSQGLKNFKNKSSPNLSPNTLHIHFIPLPLKTGKIKRTKFYTPIHRTDQEIWHPCK